MASGASGSFSTNSPASPLSSVSLTSPLSPYSPVPGSQVSPSKQLGPEVSTGRTQQGVNPFPTPVSHCRTRSSPRPRPKSCVIPHFNSEAGPKSRPKSYRESDKSPNAEHRSKNSCETRECAFPRSALVLQSPNESLTRLGTVIEETDPSVKCRMNSHISKFLNPSEPRDVDFLQAQCRDSPSGPHSNLAQARMQLQDFGWLASSMCSQEVKVGQRKDVFPDSVHASPLLVGYPNDQRNLLPNRHFSMPESQILLFQDIFQTNVLTSCHGPDLPLSYFRGDHPESSHHHQLFHSTCNAQIEAKILPLPHRQTEHHTDPMICWVPQSDSHTQPSDKVFMQTHL